jgi:hypothetical protein
MEPNGSAIDPPASVFRAGGVQLSRWEIIAFHHLVFGASLADYNVKN